MDLQELITFLKHYRSVNEAAKKAKQMADDIVVDNLMPGFAEQQRQNVTGGSVTVIYEDVDEDGQPITVQATMNPDPEPGVALDVQELHAQLSPGDWQRVCSLQFDAQLLEQAIQADPYGTVAKAYQAARKTTPPRRPWPRFTVKRNLPPPPAPQPVDQPVAQTTMPGRVRKIRIPDPPSSS